MWKKTAKKKIKSSEISQTIVLGKEKIDYVLIRDAYKTLRLRVKTDASVEVKAPKRYQQIFIDAFLQKKASWIMSKKKETLRKGVKPKMDFSQGGSCYCLGKEIFIHYGCEGNLQNFNEISLLSETSEEDMTRRLLGGQFFCTKDIYQSFLDIANNTHRDFRLAVYDGMQNGIQGAGSQVRNTQQNCLPHAKKITPNIIQGMEKNENTCSGEFASLSSEFEVLALVPTLFIRTKKNAETSHLTGINVWRKRTAALFLQLCLDRVWQKLCGDKQNNAREDTSENDSNSNTARQNIDWNNAHKQNNVERNNMPREVQAIFCKISKPNLFVRVLSRRFGSCSSKGEICLARHLISFPLELIEYVIIHECCHLVHMNHSNLFYNLMDVCCINAREKREILWDWSRKHPNF